MAQRIILTALLVVSLVGIGCTTTVINPGTDTSATYRFGKLTAEEARDISAVYAATEAAVDGLGLSVIQKVKDELEAQIVARDAQDKKITIELTSLTKNSTTITVRAGSSDKAGRIYQTIHDNL